MDGEGRWERGVLPAMTERDAMRIAPLAYWETRRDGEPVPVYLRQHAGFLFECSVIWFIDYSSALASKSVERYEGTSRILKDVARRTATAVGLLARPPILPSTSDARAV